MDTPWASLAVALGGFVTANMLFPILTSWLRAVAGVVPSPEGRRWPRVISVSLLHAGPWALALAVSIAVYASTKPSAPWFFAGVTLFCVWIGIVMGFAY